MDPTKVTTCHRTCDDKIGKNMVSTLHTRWNRAIASWRLIFLSRLSLAEGLLGFGVVYCSLIFASWYEQAVGFRLPTGQPLGVDFLNVYAAGLLVNQGHPARVYDWHLHHQMELNVVDFVVSYLGWHYPPPFLAVASFLARLPYLWAFTLYMGISLGLYVVVIYRLAPSTRLALLVILAFPGVFCNLINGQNGFITAFLFGAGFLYLEKQPWLAGIMFGFLSYKPQFFVLIPLALMLGGYYRAVLATLMTTLACAVLSWIAYGDDVWRAFLSNSFGKTPYLLLDRGLAGWSKIQSIFSWMRMWGAGVETASLCQGFIAVLSFVCLVYIWRTKTSLTLRATTLCSALLLTTPYLFDYDLVILAVPLALWACEEQIKALHLYEKALLVTLWVLPAFARFLGSHMIPSTPLLMMAFVVMSLMHTPSLGLWCQKVRTRTKA